MAKKWKKQYLGSLEGQTDVWILARTTGKLPDEDIEVETYSPRGGETFTLMPDTVVRVRVKAEVA